MVRLLNSLYLGASTLNSYGNAKDAVELLPLEYCLGSAVPHGGTNYIDVILSGVSPLTLINAKEDGLNYLKLFGGTEQKSILPAEYQQLEYIETVNQSYIDTGIVPTINSKARVKFSPSLTTQVGYFGSRRDPYRFCCTTFAQGTMFSVGMTNDTWAQNRTNIVLGDIYDTTFANGYAIINGVRYNETPVTTFGETFAFKLGLISFSSSSYSTAKYYICQLWDNDVLVFNGVPAKRLSDDVCGMYDTVTNTFFTNAGAGETIVGGSATPTPETPMDIICNNGTIKVRNKSGLPLGYQAVEYLDSSDVQYINTGITPTSNILRIKTKCQKISSNLGGSYFGVVANPAPRNGFRIYSSTADGKATLQSGSTVLTLNNQYNDVLELDITVKQGTEIICTLNGQTSNIISTGVELTNSNPMFLFGVGLDRSPSLGFPFRFWSFYVEKDGVVAGNYIPCRRKSDNVLGMYDTVSQTFLTNAGTGTFTAGADVDDMEIYVDGTTETVTVHSGNLVPLSSSANFDFSNNILSNLKTDTRTFFKLMIQVFGGSSWRAIGTFDVTSTGVKEYTFDIPSEVTDIRIKHNGETKDLFIVSGFVLPEGSYTIHFDCLSYNPTIVGGIQLKDFVLCQTPYYNGGTATAENLFKVGTYQDVQSVLDGSVTRNAGIFVLDGTEQWVMGTAGDDKFCYFTTDVINQNTTTELFCSHYGIVAPNVKENNKMCVRLNKNGFLFTDNIHCVTNASWMQYLRDQYANGTPVIVVYPLATPTTESVTGQPLTVQAGTNIVTITQASIDNLTMEISYKATS